MQAWFTCSCSFHTVALISSRLFVFWTEIHYDHRERDRFMYTYNIYPPHHHHIASVK